MSPPEEQNRQCDRLAHHKETDILGEKHESKLESSMGLENFEPEENRV